MATGVDLNGYGFLPRRRDNGEVYLSPADVHAEEFLRSLPIGKEIIIDHRKVRSPEFHRWFFAMLNKVVVATGRWPDVTQALEAVKLAVGHVEYIRKVASDELYERTKSIAVGSLKADHFKRFVNRTLDVLAFIGVDGEKLMEETDRDQGGMWKKRFGAYRKRRG